MPVPSTAADLSTTAASNSPAGADAIGTSLDDYLRSIQAIIKQQDSKGSDIASATTIDVPSSGKYFVVTGTTTIAGISDDWNGRVVVLKFSGVLQLTHSASFILPTSANITTAAGDCLIAVNESTGVWRVVVYQRADGSAFSIGQINALLDISGASGGQIKFPATQNASSNANTLDDYEEGTFTPSFTFATPGDLSVVYSTQTGRYTKIGRMVYFDVTLVMSTFTHTTASGNAQITGLPFASANDGTIALQTCQWSGITKAGYTSVAGFVAANGTTLQMIANGSGVAGSSISAADMPTGGGPTLRFTGFYTAS